MAAVLPPAAATPTPAAPPLQRRYSVSGKTLPDDVGAIKSPLQALDTTVQSTSCGLCEHGGECVRTSAKRSATQLPSPNTPSSQALPTKIARLGLEHNDMECDNDDDEEDRRTDPLPDERAEWLHDSTHATSLPDSPLCHFSHGGEEMDMEPAFSQTEQDDPMLDLSPSPPPPTSTPQTLVLQPHPAVPTLLTLPYELRREIYLNLPDLVLPYPLIYCLSTFANKKQHPLAFVSQQIRAEALAIFHSQNTWIIKLEFKIMYDAFHDWIIRLGDGAVSLRLVQIAVRGRLFKPRTSHASMNAMGAIVQQGTPPPAPGAAIIVEAYSPPDGDASFSIDLSEKWDGGRVQVLRNDGTKESGEAARTQLARLVRGLWEKRQAGTLNGQDWVNVVDRFLEITGGGAW